MRVAIVAPSPVPSTRGGAERAVDGLARAVNENTVHRCEVVKLPVDESTLGGLVDGYRSFAGLDLSDFDTVISVKYPAWMVPHHNHVVLMFHPLRGLYDTYHLFGLPEFLSPSHREVTKLLHVVRRRHDRAALREVFEQFDAVVRALGTSHPDLAFPGPLARELVHWFDLVALAPAQTRRHFALSRTVASRPGYFLPGVTPRVVYLPSSLGPLHEGGQRHLFTASRLDGPKRVDLLVEAMRHLPDDIPLLVAGTGPERARLQDLAGDDARIRFLGFVSDPQLIDLYADALAVPFVPGDEDLGLIALEAMGCATPVVTCTDSGGPTEMVTHGRTGLLAEPDPAAVADGLHRLVAAPELAEQLGRAGRERAARVTWPDAVRTLLGEEPAPTVHTLIHRSSGARPRRKVVVTATFAIHPARGGGQLRCFHLYGSLARHVDVEVVCLVDPVHRAGSTEVAPGLVQTLVPRSPDHLDVDVELSTAAGMPVSDIVAGTSIDLTPAYPRALRRAAADAAAVVVAEPYLLPALDHAQLDLPFVYDAFNVEADLKASSLPATNTGLELFEAVVDLERRAVTSAAAVTACSPDDADGLGGRYGRPVHEIIVIPNGTDTDIAVPTPAERRQAGWRWRERYATAGTGGRSPDHLAVFFASWHPPNLDAAELILDMAGDVPSTLFVLAGSHGEAFRERVTPPNVVLAGVVGDRAKRALLGCADVALNPMRSGSGTNLKVIEYLAAGAPVVSTPFGVRGLDVVDGEHLLIAEPGRFAEAVQATLDDPAGAHRRAAAGRALAVERYDWRPLGDQLHAVIQSVTRDQRTAPLISSR